MAKKTKVKASSKQKPKSRAKYNCPPELELLIYQANLVPNQSELPDFHKIYSENTSRFPMGMFTGYQFLIERIKGLPKEFLDEVGRNAFIKFNEHGTAVLNRIPLDDLKKMSYEAIWQYVNYNGMIRNYERAFIAVYSQYRTINPGLKHLVSSLENERKQDDSHFLNSPLETTIERNSAGSLQLTGLAALILKKFDDSRLRVCEVCEKIYWANRIDKKTCSSICANKLRVRLYRSLTDEEKANRKEQREANRRVKRIQKENRRKKNGTL